MTASSRANAVHGRADAGANVAREAEAMQGGARESRSRARGVRGMRASSVPSLRASSPVSRTRSRRRGVRGVIARVAYVCGLFAATGALSAPAAAPVPMLAAAALAVAAAHAAAVAAAAAAGSPAALVRAARRAHGSVAAAAAALAAARLLLVLLSLQVIGPTRIVVASSAIPPIFTYFDCLRSARQASPSSTRSSLDRRRALHGLLLVLLALWLVAYDATGGRVPAERATLVKNRVMNTRAGLAIGGKLHSLSDQVRHSSGIVVRPHVFRGRFGVSSKAPNLLSQARLRSSSAVDAPAGDHVELRPVERATVVAGARSGAGDDSPASENVKQAENRSASGADQLEDRGLSTASTVVPVGPSQASRFVSLAVAGASRVAGAASLEARNNVRAHRRLLAFVKNDDSVAEPAARLPEGGPSRSGKDVLGRAGGSDLRGDIRGHEARADRKSRVAETLSDVSRLGHVPAAENESTMVDALSDSGRVSKTGMLHSYVSLWTGLLGVAMGTMSLLGTQVEEHQVRRLSTDVGSVPLSRAIMFSGGAVLTLPLAVASCVSPSQLWNWGRTSQSSFSGVFSSQVPVFAVLLLVAPQYISSEPAGACVQGQRSPRREMSRSISRTSLLNPGPRRWDVALGDSASIVMALGVVRRMSSWLGYMDAVPLSFTLWLVLLMLLYVSVLSPTLKGDERGRSPARSGLTDGSSGPLLAYGRPSGSSLYGISRIRRAISRGLGRLVSFVAQSRDHEASWQVFNFLVMQTCMVAVESSYAFATDSVGLISISADNLFCCIALAGGLFAIRATTLQKNSSRFTYGFARLESLCGFVNGVLLIVVAVLLLLEAIDRTLNPEFIKPSHIFAVCLVGIFGNGLGLVFFPPKSRLENHNVQSIYLHIWANTLAYAGLSASALVQGLNPEWTLTELLITCFVAVVVGTSAIPLLYRSGRLLMNLPAAEKLDDVVGTRVALGKIPGVLRVSRFRAWNVTPTSMVVSTRLAVVHSCPLSDMEVLRQARDICGSRLGAPASQVTIQITRCEEGSLASFSPSRSLHAISVDVQEAVGTS